MKDTFGKQASGHAEKASYAMRTFQLGSIGSSWSLGSLKENMNPSNLGDLELAILGSRFQCFEDVSLRAGVFVGLFLNNEKVTFA